MKRWFATLPLHRKLVASALFVTAFALLIAMTGLAAFDTWRHRATAAEDADTTAQIVAENIAAAVAFQDVMAAEQALGSLQAQDVVTRACIYIPTGELMAGFTRTAQPCPHMVPAAGAWTGVFGQAPVRRNNRVYGTVYVERDLSDLRQRLLTTALAGLSMFIVAASSAYVLAHRVTRASSAPIADLARYARTYTADPDAQLPDIQTAPDEIGDLVRSFREMIRRVGATNADLQHQSSQLQLITDAIPALISYVDSDTRYVFNNKAYEDWFSHSRAEVQGRHLRDVLGPPAFERIRPYVDMALKGRRTQYEAELPHAHGRTRHVHADYVPDVRADGTVAGFFALVSDITERKRSEQALREADRRKDEFLAILAHELRNPLAPIRTSVELLRVAGDKVATLSRVQPVLERQVMHMVRMIDDLLDISRITSGRIHLQRQPTPLGDLLHSAMEMNRTLIEAAGLSTQISVPHPDCLLDVDPTRFVQVLSNVLHNATKFTPRGGEIRITQELDERSTPPTATLRLSDTGAGIPESVLPRVFDLFVQGPPSGRVTSGLGIGLALARQLVELQGGRIEALSAGEGLGSTIVITMPATVDQPAHRQTPAAVDDAPEVHHRVLIVDDNDDAAQTLAALIASFGADTRTANDGPSGLECAWEFQPELVLLDIGMPGMDGYETCQRLRAHPVGRRAHVVALTGWGQPHDRDRALANGFDDHMTKPADPRALATLLTELRTTSAESAQPPQSSA
jgi:PAS domain S-box-containing protein